MPLAIRGTACGAAERAHASAGRRAHDPGWAGCRARVGRGSLVAGASRPRRRRIARPMARPTIPRLHAHLFLRGGASRWKTSSAVADGTETRGEELYESATDPAERRESLPSPFADPSGGGAGAMARRARRRGPGTARVPQPDQHERLRALGYVTADHRAVPTPAASRQKRDRLRHLAPALLCWPSPSRRTRLRCRTGNPVSRRSSRRLLGVGLRRSDPEGEGRPLGLYVSDAALAVLEGHDRPGPVSRARVGRLPGRSPLLVRASGEPDSGGDR